MTKPNATLVWRGRKLMCNGVCVAEIEYLDLPVSWKKSQWSAATIEGNSSAVSEEETRRAVNRRFNLHPEHGTGEKR